MNELTRDKLEELVDAIAKALWVTKVTPSMYEDAVREANRVLSDLPPSRPEAVTLDEMAEELEASRPWYSR